MASLMDDLLKELEKKKKNDRDEQIAKIITAFSSFVLFGPQGLRGMVLMVAAGFLSWETNHSIAWALLQGWLCPLLYLCYRAIGLGGSLPW